jgi:hypothetical protein
MNYSSKLHLDSASKRFEMKVVLPARYLNRQMWTMTLHRASMQV